MLRKLFNRSEPVLFRQKFTSLSSYRFINIVKLSREDYALTKLRKEERRGRRGRRDVVASEQEVTHAMRDRFENRH